MATDKLMTTLPWAFPFSTGTGAIRDVICGGDRLSGEASTFLKQSELSWDLNQIQQAVCELNLKMSNS